MNFRAKVELRNTQLYEKCCAAIIKVKVADGKDIKTVGKMAEQLKPFKI